MLEPLQMEIPAGSTIDSLPLYLYYVVPISMVTAGLDFSDYLQVAQHNLLWICQRPFDRRELSEIVQTGITELCQSAQAST